MELTHIFSLLGGLGLFLYGMHLMSSAITSFARAALARRVRALTRTPVLAMFTGLAATALVQSSSAVTVMVIGLAGAGILELSKGYYLMLGANIGTTVTGQMIALHVADYAPLLAFFGVLPLLFSKRTPVMAAGGFAAGFGILFMGLNMMTAAMEPFGAHPGVFSFLARCGQPVFGVLFGAAITAVVQSSSATVGLVQLLAQGGSVGIPYALYLVLGCNIGTCATAFFAASDAGIAGKRIALLHFLVKLTGGAVFAAALGILPISDWLFTLFADDGKLQIAAFHTVFNVVNSLLFFPLGGWMIRLVTTLSGSAVRGSFARKKGRRREGEPSRFT